VNLVDKSVHGASPIGLCSSPRTLKKKLENTI
jgi:hypothetical protein